MCSTEAHRFPKKPRRGDICRPSGTWNGGEGLFATHIALLRSYNPQFFTTIQERNSPAPGRGIGRLQRHQEIKTHTYNPLTGG